MNLPADMLPMYTASMSSERSFASWIAFSPASIPRSRKERSHSSPNSVSPTSITATSRIDPGLPHGELSVRLVEDRVVVILRGRAGPFEEQLGAVDDVLEVRGFAGEATAVARIPLAFAPPEVWGVRRERDGVADVRDRAVRPDQEGGSARGRAVLEGIARRPLAGVRADRESVLHHLREGQAHRRLDRGGSRLARELEVRRGEDRRRSDRFRHDRRGRLDRVRMGLRSDVDRADLGGVDVDLRHARPRGLDGDRDDVLVGTRDALRADVQPATHRLAVGAPDHADVLRSNPVPRDVRDVAHDARLHAIRSSLEMSSPWSRSVRARMMLSNSASFTARSSMFSGCTYTTIAGFIGWALIAIIGERPYLTPVKKRALSLVDP